MGIDKPSLRHITGELGISPAYLSYMVNGKRPWRKDLYQRYMGVVNTFVNTQTTPSNDVGLNLPTSCVARSAQHLHGVQGAAGSNPAAPTIDTTRAVNTTQQGVLAAF